MQTLRSNRKDRQDSQMSHKNQESWAWEAGYGGSEVRGHFSEKLKLKLSYKGEDEEEGWVLEAEGAERGTERNLV